jgi:hypothetical protein
MPAQMKQMFTGLNATGMVTSVVGRGVKDDSGSLVAAIVLSQYNPKLTVLLDKLAPAKILDSGIKMMAAVMPDKLTTTTHVLSGSQVRLIHDASLPGSMAMSYIHGGVLVEVIGPTPASVLSFTGVYLAAVANK